MNYYLKLFLLATGVGLVNLLIYFFFLRFQIVHNSSYVPQELLVAALILLAIPIQFLIFLLIGWFFNKETLAFTITAICFMITCVISLWATSSEERARYSNERVYQQTEKYDYQQGIATPEGYPIQLLSESRFVMSVKGDRNPVTLLETQKVYSNQWGNGETTFKSSDEGPIVIPDSLKLYWYSFLENKYYSLNTKLNKSKISEYFKQGLKHDVSGKLDQIIQSNYNELVAGIAPGGDVVLWISSFNDTREIEIFKATELSIDQLKDYDLVTDEIRNQVLQDTCLCEDNVQSRKIVHNDRPIPFGTWTGKYRKKNNWRIAINDFGQTKAQLKFRLFNGERYQFFNEEITQQQYQPQAIPDYLNFTFFKDGKKHNAYLEFEENEVFRLFDQITKQHPDEPIDLVLNISPDLKQTSIKLRTKSDTLYFENMRKVEIYTK
ncbi:MAG: DUF2931 family protein [Sphingobacterium sp.]|jgi:hypothetical protein|nr:DUF2931 family protein [Sphingobacterium sp.]